MGHPHHYLATVILSARFPVLTKVTFNLSEPWNATHRSIINALDKRLCHVDFVALEEVRIDCKRSLISKLAVDKIKTAFGNVARRGVLRIVIDGEDSEGTTMTNFQVVVRVV